MDTRIQYEYDEVSKCRLVCINGMYLLVDPEDLEFWAKEAGISVSEEEAAGIAHYLSDPHKPPGSSVSRTGTIISLPGVKTYRKAKP